MSPNEDYGLVARFQMHPRFSQYPPSLI